MSLSIYKTREGWTWAVLDKQSKPFCVSMKHYSRATDAKRAFEKLDRLF